MSRLGSPPVQGAVEQGGKKPFETWWIRWINAIYKVLQGVELYPISQVLVPIAGFSFQIPNDIGNLIIEPAGPLATGSLVLPANPIDNQVITVSTTQDISVLFLTAAAGQIITNVPGSLLAGASFTYRYIVVLKTWFKQSGGAGGSGGGTVTSVGLNLPSTVFTVAGSPVTGAGVITAPFAVQNQNLVFAGPAIAPAAVPTFRALVLADLPTIPSIDLLADDQGRILMDSVGFFLTGT